ncbi:acetolactate synthase protein like [Trichuris trichiura]|uniref:2-hydroxyacyl-CoA lyase 2 n=1 Tax=Trichuris trichiura TaxID=36087 RepID=A0A077Z4N7_TRITR|nr:acetolactate synthase protein like [Trichuris trichiura]
MIMVSLLFITLSLAIMIVFLVKLLTKGNFSRNLVDVSKGRMSVFRLFYCVESDSRNFGGEIVADVLKAHGVKWVFTLCGGHISPILVSCEKNDIRVVDTRSEATAAFAADAVSRLGEPIGVACVTAGPGVTNTLTAVQNAQMAQSAVLIIGGATSPLLKGRGSLQDIDQIGIMKPVCKHVVSISRVRDIAPTLRKAIQIARSDVPGPVFVEIPVDALHPIHVVEAEMKLNKKPNSIRGYLIHWFMELYLSRLFSDAWKPADVAPLPIKYKKASTSQVKKCCNLLTRSKQPLIIIGGQAMLLPDRIQDLVSALKVINVPCYCNGMARGLLADVEPLQILHKRREALKEADLVILAGAACDFRLDYGRSLNPKAKVIAINRSKAQLRQNVNVFWKASLFLQADACDFIIQLADSISNVATYAKPEDWSCRLKTRDQQAEEDISRLAKTDTLTSPGINPVALLRNVEELIPKDAIIVMDGGDFVGTAAYVLKARGPLKWLDPGAFGTLGVGAGFALGAKLCHPDLPVWIIFGDGAFGFSVAEIDSLVRHQTPVIAIIGNDNGWAQIHRTQISLFGSSVGCILSPAIAYEKVAEGFGAIGFAVNSSNANELNKMVTSIKDQPRAVFVNALIGRTNFRDGSISI